MQFPEAERVIYERNPLKLVVCQLRFPVDLHIEMGMTAGFQDKIRSRFPFAEEHTDESIPLMANEMSEQFPKELVESLSAAINRQFQFMTEDKVWTIGLTRNFAALETSNYEKWEDFRKNIDLTLSALVESYKLPFFTRVGLRYVNVIDRVGLGLQGCEWRDLLADFITGPLAIQGYELHIPEYKATHMIELENPEDVVRIQHGLIGESSTEEYKSVYVLDNDFFTKADTVTEVDNVIRRLDDYNSQNRGLFQSCIKDKLHRAMGPKHRRH